MKNIIYASDKTNWMYQVGTVCQINYRNPTARPGDFDSMVEPKTWGITTSIQCVELQHKICEIIATHNGVFAFVDPKKYSYIVYVLELDIYVRIHGAYLDPI